MSDIRLADTLGNKTWTSTKMDWLDCIAYDRRLKPVDFEVAFVVIQHTNAKTGECYPSEETIAHKCGLRSTRQVRRALKRLCATGWLKRKRRPNTSTVYTPLHGNVNNILDEIAVAKQAASAARSRGKTAAAICLDECAFLKSGDAIDSDVDLVTALRPSLATTGGPLLLTSSPAGAQGLVYSLYKRHYGPNGDKRCIVAHSDARGLNPRLKQSVIDKAYEDDPDAAAGHTD